MPKVSEEHLERRRQQILDAARDCFVRDGFHNTSMQDIFKASGLSAGAVYRYFPSKRELIKAIARRSLTEALGRLRWADANGSPGAGPGEASRGLADIVEALAGVFAEGGPLTGMRPIIMQVWAEAGRDPEMAVVARDLLGQVMERIDDVLPPGMPPEVTRLLTAALQGFIVQSELFGDVTRELVATAARAGFR